MDKIKDVDWRGLYKTATQKVKKYTLNLTDLELKVEDATNAETWGPHGSVMNEIADAAFDPENYRQIMGVLARRLSSPPEAWRMCYKALLLLEHLLKHGPGKIVGDVQSSAAVLDRLQNFEFKDENMKDHGVNVRHRAKEILQLVNSPDRLREEREKAKQNRAKYRGVSADQMRTGSFGRSTSDHYSSGTSGSLFPGGGGGGSLGGGGGGLGGGSSGLGGGYGSMSRRTDSYDETDEGAHYISKRGGSSAAPLNAGPSGGGGAAGGGGGSATEEALAATRARIDRLKLSGAGAEDKAAAVDEKKKLHDVRVNPKIAASLGLKLPAAAPPPPSSAPPTAAPAASTPVPAAAGMDLLGGLEEPSAAAAAPPPAAAAFDPFAAAAAPAAAPAQQSWDAFGGAPAAASRAPAQAAGVVDMLGGLDLGPSAPAPAFQQPAAAPSDPFAGFAAPAPAMPFAAPRPAAAAPTAPLPTVAAGVPAALPEDMFSDLTGIGGRAQRQPMGHAPPAAPAAFPAPQAPAAQLGGATGGAMGWGMPGASPPSPGGGFGSFSGGTAAAAPPASIGMGGMGFGGPPAQPPPGHGHARSGSMGGGLDFGSLSYSSPPAGGASAADPFADLLK